MTCQDASTRASHCSGLTNRDGQPQRMLGRLPTDNTGFTQSRCAKTTFRPISPSSRQRPSGVKFTARPTIDGEDTDDNGSCQDVGSESDDSANENNNRAFQPERAAARNRFRQESELKSGSDKADNKVRLKAPGRKSRSKASTSLALPALQPPSSSGAPRTSMCGGRMSFAGVACGTLASAGPTGVSLAFLDALRSTSRPGTTLRDLFTSLILPATRTARCAYVSLLGSEFRARPIFVLACSWEETVADVVALVVDHAASLASQHQQPSAVGGHPQQPAGTAAAHGGRLHPGHEGTVEEQGSAAAHTDLGGEEANGAAGGFTMANGGGGRGGGSFAVWLDLLSVNFHAPVGPAMGPRFSISGTPVQSYSLEAVARERARALPGAVASTRAVLLLPGAHGAGLREHPVILALWYALRGRGCSGGATLSVASTLDMDIGLVKAAFESLTVAANATGEDAVSSSEGGSGGAYGLGSEAAAAEATGPSGGQSRMSPDRLAMRALRDGAAGSAAAAAMAAIFAADPLPSRTVREGLMAAAIGMGMALLARPVMAGAGARTGASSGGSPPKAQSSASLLPPPQLHTHLQSPQPHQQPSAQNPPMHPTPCANPSGFTTQINSHPPILLPSPSGHRAALPSPVRPSAGDSAADGSGGTVSIFKRPVVLLSEAWSLSPASPGSPATSVVTTSATGIERVFREASGRKLSFTHLLNVRAALAAREAAGGDCCVGGSSGPGPVAANAAYGTGPVVARSTADFRYGGGSDGAGGNVTAPVETDATHDGCFGEADGGALEGGLLSTESFTCVRRLPSLVPLLDAPALERSGGSGSGSNGGVRLQRLRSIAPAPWESASPLPSPLSQGVQRPTLSTAIGALASPLRAVGPGSGGMEGRGAEEALGLQELASPPASRKSLSVLTSPASQQSLGAEGSGPPGATPAAAVVAATDAAATPAAISQQLLMPPPRRRTLPCTTSGTGHSSELPSSIIVLPSPTGTGLSSTTSSPLPRLSIAISEAHPGPWGATGAAAVMSEGASSSAFGEAHSSLRGGSVRQQFSVRPRRVMTLSSLRGTETDDSSCDTYDASDNEVVAAEVPPRTPSRVQASASFNAATSHVRASQAAVVSASSPSAAVAAVAVAQSPTPLAPPLAPDLARLVAAARLLAALGQPSLSLRLARHALTSARHVYGARHLDSARCAVALACLATHFQQQEQEQQTKPTSQQQKRQKERREDETRGGSGSCMRGGQPEGQSQGNNGWRPYEVPRRVNGISNNWQDASSGIPAAAKGDLDSEPVFQTPDHVDQDDSASVGGAISSDDDDTCDNGRDLYSGLLPARMHVGSHGNGGNIGSGGGQNDVGTSFPLWSGGGPRVAADKLNSSNPLAEPTLEPPAAVPEGSSSTTRSRCRSDNAAFTIPAMSLSLVSCSVASPSPSTLRKTPSLSTLAPSSPPSPSGTGVGGDAWSAVCFTGELEVLLRGAAVVLKDHLGPGHDEVLAARRALAALMAMEGRHEEALQQLLRLTADTPMPCPAAPSAGPAAAASAAARFGPSPLRRPPPAFLCSEVALSCRLDLAAAQVAVGQQRDARKTLQVLLALLPGDDSETGVYGAVGARGGQPAPGSGGGGWVLSGLKCAQLEARAAHQLARLEVEAEEPRAAQVMYRRAIASYSLVYGSLHVTTASAMLDLASLDLTVHEYIEAKELYQIVLEIYLEQYGAHHPTTTRVSSRLIEVEEAIEDLEDA